MKFMEAVKTVWRKYASGTGRASRSEFWWWALFTVLVELVLGFIDDRIFGRGYTHRVWSPLMDLFDLVALLPSIAVSIRRLHDVDRSGLWWVSSIILVPYIVFVFLKGTQGPNRFGPDPLAVEAVELATD